MADDDQGDLPFDLPEAFEDLSEDTLAAIRGPVTAEQVLDYVSVLTKVPVHAEDFRRALLRFPWWKPLTTRDTQLRRMRTIRDAAITFGYPVCTTNKGYALGDWADVQATARRATRMAEGAWKRARRLEQFALTMVA
jgi:hypothetical protein